MLYTSTRGGVREGISFKQALFSGYAPDGGLYMPQTVPSISEEKWKGMAKLSYEELSKRIFRYFVSKDEIPDTEYDNIFEGAYSDIQHSEVLPIVAIGDYNIMEMWHGPSGSLKDFSLGLVTRFINYFCQRDKIKAVGVVGTLGDTGCAAIQSCKGRDNIRLVVLYPKNGVSEMQRLSMTTVQSPYIRVYGCECSSDEFDKDIKAVFNDKPFTASHNLLWLNSINIGRVLSHTIFHIYCYLKLCPKFNSEVTVYLPTGGVGNAAGGALAQRMGLPIKLVAAVNENDCIYQCFGRGILKHPTEIIRTHACAIESYTVPNLERVLYLISRDNAELVKQLMLDFEAGKEVSLPKSLWLDQTMLKSVRVDQESALTVARDLWTQHRYIMCPHSAVAVAAIALERQRRKEHDSSAATTTTEVAYSTATSAKFPNFVQAVDPNAPLTEHPVITGLTSCPEQNRTMKQGENWEHLLKQSIEELYAML